MTEKEIFRGSPPKKVSSSNNLFAEVTQRLGVLPGVSKGFNDIVKLSEEGTQTFNTPIDKIRREAETIAQDAVKNFGDDNMKRPPNKYCKRMRKTVKELSDRHDLVFKGMVTRLKPDESSVFSTFVDVADELFADGQINWGRIVAVYAFAARLARYYKESNGYNSQEVLTELQIKNHQEKIGLYLGKYVANKLSQWILDHGGWDAFVDYFPDQEEFEEKIWKGVLYTAIGLGALATAVATR